VAGLISKLTNAGQDLDQSGYVQCSKFILQNPNEEIKCFGVMKVPVDRFQNIEEMEKNGPFSEESISEGIKLLMEIAGCVCESTKISLRKTIDDVTMISKLEFFSLEFP